jgi:steroid delta-isomerase-like uncharacterized protein
VSEGHEVRHPDTRYPDSPHQIVARRALQALAAGEITELESYVTSGYVFRSQLAGKPADRAALRDRAMLLATTLHGARLAIELVLEDGDYVVCRWTGRAVHGGNLAGVPATGRPVQVAGITIFRFEGDLVAEEWTEFDGLTLLAQIGARREHL